MSYGGGGEVGVRGQPLPSSILCLDSVLSAAPPRVGKHRSGRGGEVGGLPRVEMKLMSADLARPNPPPDPTRTPTPL